MQGVESEETGVMTPYCRGSTMAGASTLSFPGQAGESIDPAFKGKGKETAPPEKYPLPSDPANGTTGIKGR